MPITIVRPVDYSTTIRMGAMHNIATHAGKPVDMFDYVTLWLGMCKFWISSESGEEHKRYNNFEEYITTTLQSEVSAADINKEGPNLRYCMLVASDDVCYTTFLQMMVMFQKVELKNQKMKRDRGRPKAGSIPVPKPFPTTKFHMLTSLIPLEDRRRLLLSLVTKELSIEGFHKECKDLKGLIRAQSGLIACTQTIDWDDCKTKYPDMANESFLKSFTKLFTKTHAGSTIASCSAVFRDAVNDGMQAQKIAEVTATRAVDAGRLIAHIRCFQLPTVTHQCILQNALSPSIIQHLPRKNYQLVVIDPPYGLGVAPWDHMGWGDTELTRVLTAIVAVNASDRMTVICFSGQDKLQELVASMTRVLMYPPTVCVWSKPNTHSTPNNVAWAFEYILVGCYNRVSTVVLDQHWFYPADEQKVSAFICDTVTRRKRTEEDEINPCQKPVGLLKYLVQHFSTVSANVLDICAGTGQCCIFLCKQYLTYSSQVQPLSHAC